jgi:hypothetical protein
LTNVDGCGIFVAVGTEINKKDNEHQFGNNLLLSVL